jgi:hypothetical protein
MVVDPFEPPKILKARATSACDTICDTTFDEPPKILKARATSACDTICDKTYDVTKIAAKQKYIR